MPSRLLGAPANTMRPACPMWSLAWAVAWGLAWAGGAQGQVEFANRPISKVEIRGLKEVSPVLVRNQLRAVEGKAFEERVVGEDLVRLTHLGRFAAINRLVQPQPDGSVWLIWELAEQPLLADVQVLGNKRIPDEKLVGYAGKQGFQPGLVGLQAGDPADDFLIGKGRQRILDAYAQRGYYLTEVGIDEDLLRRSRILLYRVREGPLLTIREVRFRGNTSFPDDELASEVKSKSYVPIFRDGELDRERLVQDVDAVRRYYLDRGHLEVAVGRQVEVADNQEDAVVTFVIEEGPRYTVDSITVTGSTVLPAEQVVRAMELRVGDAYGADKVRRSQRAVEDLHGRLGYIRAKVRIERAYLPGSRLKVTVSVDPGRAYTVGALTVKGNTKTQDKTVLREVRGLLPGRRFDGTGVSTTERRLRETQLYTDAKVTVLGQDEDAERDVLVEVTEGSTASFNIGAALSSDSGLVGAISYQQRNFDLTDFPETFSELVGGQAFRGAGQFFSVNLQPGNEQSRYAVNFREPYLLDSDFFLSSGVFYFERQREDWDERRFGTTLGLGQRFGDVWSAQLAARGELVNLGEISAAGPRDAFAVAGDNVVTSLGPVVTRDTRDSGLFPTQGTQTVLGVHRIGALGGDFNFTRLDGEFHKYWTVDEDFLERRTVLALRVEAGYILEENESPIFERFYAGGHRTIRGFDFRGASPLGLRNDTGLRGDDPVGGDFVFLAGLEYNYPIYSNLLRGVVFVDTGTVDAEPDLSKLRVSVGAGVRLSLPFFGQVPIAIDFAVPLVKEDGDEHRLISFDAALPF